VALVSALMLCLAGTGAIEPLRNNTIAISQGGVVNGTGTFSLVLTW
jgi:hypothetical protein